MFNSPFLAQNTVFSHEKPGSVRWPGVKHKIICILGDKLINVILTVQYLKIILQDFFLLKNFGPGPRIPFQSNDHQLPTGSQSDNFSLTFMKFMIYDSGFFERFTLNSSTPGVPKTPSVQPVVPDLLTVTIKLERCQLYPQNSWE